jgi:hypothetical protein
MQYSCHNKTSWQWQAWKTYDISKHIRKVKFIKIFTVMQYNVSNIFVHQSPYQSLAVDESLCKITEGRAEMINHKMKFRFICWIWILNNKECSGLHKVQCSQRKHDSFHWLFELVTVMMLHMQPVPWNTALKAACTFSVQNTYITHEQDQLDAASDCRDPESVLGDFRLDSWWTKWHQNSFFSKLLSSPLLSSFCHCSILKYYCPTRYSCDQAVHYRALDSKLGTYLWLSP